MEISKLGIMGGIVSWTINKYQYFNEILSGPSARYNPFSPVFLARYFLWKKISRATRYFSGILIDVGSGKKPYKGLISQSCRYLGFDYPSYFSRLDSKEDEIKPDIAGDGTRLPFKSRSADVVFSVHVIEHVFDTNLLINEMCRILKDGGFLVMCAPLTYPLHHKTLDFYRFTNIAIERLLKSSNMDIEWLEANEGILITQCQLFLYYFNYRFMIRSRHDLIWLIFSAARVMLIPFFLLVTFILNCCAVILNMVDNDTIMPLNYTVVAKKRYSN